MSLILMLTTLSCAAVTARENKCRVNCAHEIARLDFEVAKARAAQMEVVAPWAVGRTLSDLDKAHLHYADFSSRSQVQSDVRSARQNMALAKKIFGCRKESLEPILRAREEARFAVNRCSTPKPEWIYELIELDQRFKVLTADGDPLCSISVVDDPSWNHLRRSYLEFALKLKNMNCLLLLGSS